MNDNWSNSAYILWLIRSKSASNYIEICKHFGWNPEVLHTGTGYIREIIMDLERVGLIELESALPNSISLESSFYERFLPETKLLITNKAVEMLTVLKISLKELSKRSYDSILIKPLFRLKESTKNKYDIFVLMPFTDSIKPVYEDHIKNVAESLKKTVARADDFFSVNSIMDDVCQSIYLSDIIIADCTNMNPNVFYEIGIAHTLGKNVILLTSNEKDIPFDIRHIRHITYEYTPRGMKSFEENLKSTIQELDYYNRSGY